MINIFKKTIEEPAEKQEDFRFSYTGENPEITPVIQSLAAADANPDITMDGMGDGIKSVYADGDDYFPLDQLIWYASHSFIGYQACMTISQHWLVDKVCTMPARDAVRVGWELKGDGLTSDIQAKLRKADKRYKVNKNLVEFERLNRVFGQRLLMFVIDGIDYEKPFNIDGVRPGSYKGIVQVDPFWISPIVDNTSDPTRPDFYEPTYYKIGNKTIHKSHVIVNKTCEVPDILKPTYRYGGVPLAQRLMERVYAAERTANEAPMLAMTKRLDILKMDLVEAMGKKSAFKKLMHFFTETRDNYGVKVIGQNEEMSRLDTALADLDTVIMTQYQLVAAVGEMPATKLLETTPKGFNATGEFEESSYHERLEGIQEHSLTPVLDRHYQIVMKSEGLGDIDIEVVWMPLDSPTEVEWSQINLARAQTGQVLIASGAIDADDERERVKADPDSGYTNLEDREEGENIFEGLLDDPTAEPEVPEVNNGE